MAFPTTRLSRHAAIVLAAATLLLAAANRGPDYDEGYTALVTSTDARPDWPERIVTAVEITQAMRPAPSPAAILGTLRRTDVHPPLYFWLAWGWRRVFGPDLFVTRLLSVGLSLAALLLVAGWARATGGGLGQRAMLIALGCYGFTASGIVARGFALAQLLSLLGLVLAWKAQARNSPRLALAGGLACGAASFTNYLASFPAAAALFWTLWRGERRGARAAALLLGQSPFIVADASLFLAQRGSRVGQFEPFGVAHFLHALARATGGAVLGGLPLYLPPTWRGIALLPLGLLLAGLLALPLLRWHRLRGDGDVALLWALAAVSLPCGLLVMGVASDSLPVEIRYLAFALPPFALLLDRSLRGWWGGGATARLLLAVQAASIAGLCLSPVTMQPEGAAARLAARLAGRQGLVLLPRGNDGVGIVTSFATAAPPWLRLRLLRPEDAPTIVRAARAQEPRLILVPLAVDDASRAVAALMRDAPADCRPGAEACSRLLLLQAGATRGSPGT